MSRSRIVFVTQQVDPEHPILAATVPKIRALAERLDEVVVLADRSVPDALPANVRVRSFGAASRGGRGLRFTASLAAELARRPRPLAVVAHMCPIYAVLAAPLARPCGVPVVLWFNHWRRSATAERAERLASLIVSVEARSFPIPTPKLRAIGHGIDLREFPCVPPQRRGESLHAVVLGRYSEAKGVEAVLHAARQAVDRGLDLRVDVHGASPTPEAGEHRQLLERLVGELGLGERVTIGDPVPRREIPALLARADVLVNNMREGALDKVVYEAAASCRIVVASNSGFDSFLDGLGVPLQFDRSRPDELADRLLTLAALPVEERARIGEALRERVAAGHSVEAWARQLLELVAG